MTLEERESFTKDSYLIEKAVNSTMHVIQLVEPWWMSELPKVIVLDDDHDDSDCKQKYPQKSIRVRPFQSQEMKKINDNLIFNIVDILLV